MLYKDLKKERQINKIVSKYKMKHLKLHKNDEVEGVARSYSQQKGLLDIDNFSM